MYRPNCSSWKPISHLLGVILFPCNIWVYTIDNNNIFLFSGTDPPDPIILLLILLFLFLLGNAIQKAWRSVVSNRIKMKFGRIVPQVNRHRLTESDFRVDVILSGWRPWRPPAARCCICSSVRRLPASPTSACDVIILLQFPIHSALISFNTQRDDDLFIHYFTCSYPTSWWFFSCWLLQFQPQSSW